MPIDQLPDNIQRWTAQRRAALILSILKGETSIAEAARERDLTVAELEEWRERYVLAAENALRSKPRDEEALHQERIRRLERKVGQLVLDADILKEAMKGHPFASKMSDE